MNRRCDMNKKKTTIEVSLAGLILVAISLSVLAVATDRMVQSIQSYERMSGTGDYSIDEKEYKEVL